jgi:hypothetical protein
MVQDLLVKAQEQAEEWDGVWAQGGEEWEETALGQVPAGIVFALVVGLRFRIKQAFLAMT